MQAEISMWIKFALSGESDKIFQYITDRLESKMEEKCSNVFELKKRSTTVKGTYFEVFCCMYLTALGYKVWMLRDLPPELRSMFSLPKNDKGIDLIAFDNNNYPIAVQVKYRHCTGIKTRYKPHGKTGVTWTDLSTFYALCATTGPWHKHLVMTNCNFVSHMGMKSYKDHTIASQTFKSLPREIWLRMVGSVGNVLGSNPDGLPTESLSIHVPSSQSLTPEQLREKRLQHYQK